MVFITRRATTVSEELRQFREDCGDASPSVFGMPAKTVNRRIKDAGLVRIGQWPGGIDGSQSRASRERIAVCRFLHLNRSD